MSCWLVQVLPFLVAAAVYSVFVLTVVGDVAVHLRPIIK